MTVPSTLLRLFPCSPGCPYTVAVRRAVAAIEFWFVLCSCPDARLKLFGGSGPPSECRSNPFRLIFFLFPLHTCRHKLQGQRVPTTQHFSTS
ncbi:hypothetical protein K1719_024555 [Acacia pycnantha]|nr:hypothetical protein K1719_024555 [Acacia pycnantha]